MADPDDTSYCPALPGLEPHDYQPFLDWMQGKSIALCSQCGDFFTVGDLDVNVYMPILSKLGLPSLGSQPATQPASSPIPWKSLFPPSGSTNP